MSVKLISSNEKLQQCELSIDEELTIYVALSYKEELTNYLAIYQSFDIDLSLIEEIDSAGIQLLLAFRNKIKTLGHHLTIKKPSDACNKIFKRYGLTLAELCCGEIN
tara:strand:+ start:12246 stop:12566 length:321 start_codon:yes stop_codon:yes gene_type:complete